MGTHSFQLIIATQWYCPPAVGYADRNSASEAARARLQIPAVTRPQMTEVGPPEGRASEREAERAVQELRMAKARPSMARGEKLRCNSCLWPSLARWEESLLGGATTLDFRREVDMVSGWCEMRWGWGDW